MRSVLHSFHANNKHSPNLLLRARSSTFFFHCSRPPQHSVVFSAPACHISLNSYKRVSDSVNLLPSALRPRKHSTCEEQLINEPVLTGLSVLHAVLISSTSSVAGWNWLMEINCKIRESVEGGEEENVRGVEEADCKLF